MTGAYSPLIETLIRGPLPQQYAVLAYDAAAAPIPLTVERCTITFDESWWPHVQGTLTARVADDQTTLDRLDPRAKVRVEIHAGYRLPDGTTDVHLLARCWLVSRSTVRPDDTLDLDIEGEEYLAGRSYELTGLVTIATKTAWSSTTEARAAVNECLKAVGAVADAGGWDYVNASPETGWSGDGADAYGAQLPVQGARPLEVAADIAALVGAWLYADGNGVWHMPTKPVLAAGQAAHQLKVGENGTVITSSTTLERGEDWANAVLVEVAWAKKIAGAWEDQDPLWGRAWLSSGPYSVGNVGAVVAKLERRIRTYAPQSALNRMARDLLAKRLTLGRSLNLSAVSAYWLRPTDTVTVQLPLGDQERLLVSAITYDLDAGSMTITTRLPENVAGITIGG